MISTTTTALPNATADSLILFWSRSRFLGRGVGGADGRGALAGSGFRFQGRGVLLDDAEAAFDGVIGCSLAVHSGDFFVVELGIEY